MSKFRVLYAAFAAFLLYVCLHSSTAHAEASIFFADDTLSISWPSGVERTDCSSELRAKVGETCAQLGPEGRLGVIFLTKNAGYALGNEGALSAHLKASEEALSGIPNIHVMQSRVLQTSPLLGLMEILRKDGGLAGIEGLGQPPIRQTSFLIPVGSELAQVFVYLPSEDTVSAGIYAQLFEHLQAEIRVLKVPESAIENEPEVQEGALSLMPKALLWGGLIALIGILWVTVRRRR